MRSLWSGAISFGLVNIPVRLYGASRERSLPMHFLHRRDLSPIRFARICRRDGQEVPMNEIVRGYEHQKGEYVVLSDAELKALDPRKTRTLDIEDFAATSEIDPILFEKPYYLEPEEGAEKAYATLRDALEKSGKVAIAHFVLRDREHLGAIRADGDLLVVNRLRFADEVRPRKGVHAPARGKSSRRELDLALALIDDLSRPFSIDNYRDTYHEELQELIDRKVAGKKIKRRKTVEEAPPVHDLMDALKKSLAARQRKAA